MTHKTKKQKKKIKKIKKHLKEILKLMGETNFETSDDVSITFERSNPVWTNVNIDFFIASKKDSK